jgi:hypothetical protein
MSGYSGELLSQHGIGQGTVTVLEKPFPAHRLLRAVRGSLDAVVAR